ncbi:hypothetical protein FRC18_011985 [Serendipita sp. 400]|nr:hypothetical protein FRC18_011985 [Serendipita sp. 400]
MVVFINALCGKRSAPVDLGPMPQTTLMTSRSQHRALAARPRLRQLRLAPPLPPPPALLLLRRPGPHPRRLLAQRALLPVALRRPRRPTTAPGGGLTALGRK